MTMYLDELDEDIDNHTMLTEMLDELDNMVDYWPPESIKIVISIDMSSYLSPYMDWSNKPPRFASPYTDHQVEIIHGVSKYLSAVPII